MGCLEIFNDHRKCWVLFYSIIRLCLVVLTILMLVYSYSGKSQAAIDIDPITQTNADWSITPFVDIKVSTTPCGTGEKSVLSYTWVGT